MVRDQKEYQSRSILHAHLGSSLSNGLYTINTDADVSIRYWWQNTDANFDVN